MTLIENMTLTELGAERRIQLRRIDSAKAALKKIHGKTDYSDEIAKYFHLGKVGFRKDTKKQSQTLDRAIDNGVMACEYYDIIESAKSRCWAIDRAVNFIAENKDYGETEGQIKENKQKIAVETAKALKWDKVAGHYGTAYQHGEYVVERCDPGFVAVRDTKGNLLSHHKTVKEAKAFVALAIEKSA